MSNAECPNNHMRERIAGLLGLSPKDRKHWPVDTMDQLIAKEMIGGIGAIMPEIERMKKARRHPEG